MSKIIGGDIIEDTSQYQFFVQLRLRSYEIGVNPGYIFRGGGALIDPFWVLTAAHLFTMVPGEADKRDVALCLNNNSIYEQHIDIEKSYQFPNTEKYRGVDIALVKLKSSGTEVGAKTIDLYKLPITFGKEVRMIGRGFSEGGLHHDDKLRFADNLIAFPEMCMNDISSNSFDEKYYHCVGDELLKVRTGGGDSGSPLLIKNDFTGEFELGGVVSGNVPITEPDEHGVGEISDKYTRYTKLTPEVFDWIKSTIENN